MTYICIGLAVLLIFVASKCVLYYASICGLMYYIYEQYNEEIDIGKARNIRDKALARIIRDAAGGSSH